MLNKDNSHSAAQVLPGAKLNWNRVCRQGLKKLGPTSWEHQKEEVCVTIGLAYFMVYVHVML